LFEEYISKTPKSKALYERARKVLPSGVSYGIRYFEPYPFYAARATGSKLYDADENEYLDFWLGHTTHILGHSPPDVIDVVKRQIEKGTHYGVSHEFEVALAEQVVKMVPSVEMIRFTNSGTEANMYATRLARACTGRNTIAKFEGGWHGGYDALHVGVKQPFDVPESAGLTAGAIQDTVLLPFNDLDGVKRRAHGKKLASIVVEPVLGGGGGIPAEKEFLKGLREFCDREDILLIFDEVITGFRLAPGGGQQYYGVNPDITVLGKIMGGGFPVGAFGASKGIMEKIDSMKFKRPEYSFHGGTFAGNPVTMVAGLATLRLLEDGKLIDRLNKNGEKIRNELGDILGMYVRDSQVTGISSLFNVHFAKNTINDAVTCANEDKNKLLDFQLDLIAKGIFFLPTHTGTISSAHSKADIEKFLQKTEMYAKGHGKSGG
jgi:glutamate-1-semialdehyde 2,1-aminomutase